MQRAPIAARCFALAWAIVGLLSCSSHLDRFRSEWSTLREGGEPPCSNVSDCRALLDRLASARRHVCGEQPTCDATMDLEKEVQTAVLDRFLKPCEQGDAQSCFDAHEFGHKDGLRASCEMGLEEGCVAACAEHGKATARKCREIAQQRQELLDKCGFKRGDRPVACRMLGEFIHAMSASAPMLPPRIDVDPPQWYATPMLPDRPRHRYALDFLSRACFLGDEEGCRGLCRRNPDESRSVDLSECRRIIKDQTAKDLYGACREKDGRACRDLAILHTRMSFFDKDPAGFFISGPGRVTGLKSIACQLGVQEACGEHDGW